MSRKALRRGMIDQLRAAVVSEGLALTRRECGSAPLSGMPPASMGERYVGVWVGARKTQGVSHGLVEEYSAIVTVTYRIAGVYPYDRLGELLDDDDFGFDDFVDSIRMCLHLDHVDGRVLSRANTYIASDGGPFAQGLQFVGDEDPAPVDGTWFWGKATAHPVGIVQRLRFGKILRTQNLFSTQGVT